jgi:hypothetical protein
MEVDRSNAHNATVISVNEEAAELSSYNRTVEA